MEVRPSMARPSYVSFPISIKQQLILTICQGFSCPVQQGSSALPTAAELAFANVTSVGLTVFEIMSNTNGKYSEDCLNLNVWTKPQVGEAKKAVLVWIYGGGFNSGSSSIPGYNAANIAEQEDVIVVSFK